MENQRIKILLDCFFAQTCSPAEKEELMQLLNSGKYDEIIKAYLEGAWAKGNGPHQLTNLQSDTILSAILSKSTNSQIPPADSHRFKKWYWAAAAILLVAVFSTARILFSGPSGQHNILASGNHPSKFQNDIAPGSNGAILTLADGSVIVLDSASDGNLAKQGTAKILKAGGSVKYVSQAGKDAADGGFNTIGTPKGRQFQLVLEDGTKVWLNAASSINFPAVFDKKERHVDITGEVYFEVAKNPNRPFTVSVRGMQVKVLGTHFNINAYDDEDAISTTLLEGSVKVVNKDIVKMLAPGEQSQLENSGILNLVKNVNTDEIVAWKNDLFTFDDTDLRSLSRQLARWYDVEMVLPKVIKPEGFNGTLPRRSNLSDVLKMLELTGEVSFTIEGKKVFVTM